MVEIVFASRLVIMERDISRIDGALVHLLLIVLLVHLRLAHVSVLVKLLHMVVLHGCHVRVLLVMMHTWAHLSVVNAVGRKTTAVFRRSVVLARKAIILMTMTSMVMRGRMPGDRCSCGTCVFFSLLRCCLGHSKRPAKFFKRCMVSRCFRRS